MTSTRRRWLTMATGVASLVLASGVIHADSERVEGELTHYVVDYPVEEAEQDRQPENKRLASDRTSSRQPRYRAEHVYYLETDDGQEIALEPGESGAFDGMSTGARVAVEGRRMALSADSDTTPQQMRVTDAERLAPARQTEDAGPERATVDGNPVAASHNNGSIDKRRALGVVVKFKGSSEKVDKQKAREALFAGGRSAEGAYRIASGGSADSGGQFSFFPPSGGDPKVIEVEIDASTNSCGRFDWLAWGSKVDDKVSSRGIGYDSHGSRVLFLPPGVTNACRWTGLAPLDCDNCQAFVRGSGKGTTGHELGHNLGLEHTRGKRNGEVQEYGEPTLMGIGGEYMNVPQRESLGFYGDHQDKLQTVDSGVRTVTLGGLHTDYDGEQPHAIKLPMNNSNKLYYIYHLDDAGPSRGWAVPTNQVAVTQVEKGSTYTLNRRYMTSGDQFTDDGNDITVTVNSIGDDQAKVKVQNGEKQIAAIDKSWTMAPGKEYEGQLEANDPKGRDLTFNQAKGPGKGSVSINADGSFAYTANGDASGSDSFTFRVQAGETTSEPAKASIDFNQPPKTGDLTMEVDVGEKTTAEFDASDNESKADKLAYELTDKPDKGEVSLKKGDTFRYQADEGVSGEDSFTYRASDSFSQSTESKVTIDLAKNDDSSDPFDDGDDSGSGGSTSSGDDDDGGGGAIGVWSLLLLLGLSSIGRSRALRPSTTV